MAAQAGETVYLFVSSTFNDMHAERDYLVKEVFPELRDWCEERKLRLVGIDLRWGVSEADATHNQRVVEVCLQNIDRFHAAGKLGCAMAFTRGQASERDRARALRGCGRAVEQRRWAAAIDLGGAAENGKVADREGSTEPG